MEEDREWKRVIGSWTDQCTQRVRKEQIKRARELTIRLVLGHWNVADAPHPPIRNIKVYRLLCPQDFPGKSPGVGCQALLQRIFPTQGSNPCLSCFLYWQAVSLPLVPPGKQIRRLQLPKRRFQVNLDPCPLSGLPPPFLQEYTHKENLQWEQSSCL